MTLVAASFRKVFFPPFMILDTIDLVFNFVERNCVQFFLEIHAYAENISKHASKCTHLLPN